MNLEERPDTIPEREQELIIQRKIAKTSVQLLDEKYDTERKGNDHLDNLYSRLRLDMDFFEQDRKEIINTPDNSVTNFRRIYLELLERQREMLMEMNRRAEFDEELIRKYLALIDMEEFKIREKNFEEI